MKKVYCLIVAMLLIAGLKSNAQTCEWAENIQSNYSDDYARKIATDNSGNVYVAGYFESGTLTFNNGKSIENSGSNDGFLAKYNASGVCLWAEGQAGSHDDMTTSVDIDPSGNVYVAGKFRSSIMHFNNGITLNTSEYYDGFLAKYNANGICVWAEKISSIGTNDDKEWILTTDPFGNVYFAGVFFYDTVFFNNGIYLTNQTMGDVFLAKYNSSGTCLWAERITGSDTDYAYDVSTDDAGNVYVSGGTYSTSLTFNNGVGFQIIDPFDGYFAKYNSEGTCQWARNIQGTSSVRGVESFGENNIIVTGTFMGDTCKFNNGISVNKSWTTRALFLAGYNAKGVCQWAKKIYGSDDRVKDIFIDDSGCIYITGYVHSSHIYFNPMLNTGEHYTKPERYYSMAYLARYDHTGVCHWGEYINGSYWDYASGICVSPAGEVFVAGHYHSNTLNFNNGISLSNNGSGTAYLAKYSQNDMVTHTITIPAGWRGISANVSPANSSLETLFGSHGDDFKMIFNLEGAFCPDYDINTITSWKSDNGYAVKTANPITIEFQGWPMQNKLLELDAGWNLIPVLTNEPYDVWNIIDWTMTLPVLKEVAGTRIFWPEKGIWTLDYLEPNKSYYLYLSEPSIIIFE